MRPLVRSCGVVPSRTMRPRAGPLPRLTIRSAAVEARLPVSLVRALMLFRTPSLNGSSERQEVLLFPKERGTYREVPYRIALFTDGTLERGDVHPSRPR
jgi:hypothetical protein